MQSAEESLRILAALNLPPLLFPCYHFQFLYQAT